MKPLGMHLMTQKLFYLQQISQKLHVHNYHNQNNFITYTQNQCQNYCDTTTNTFMILGHHMPKSTPRSFSPSL